MASSSHRWSSPMSINGTTTNHASATTTTSTASTRVQLHSSMTTINSAKVFDLTSLYNERAGPRIDSPLVLRDLANYSPTPGSISPVSTPDYTHVTNLYPSLQPQQLRCGHPDSSPYRYSPATASASEITTSTMSLPQQQTQALLPDAHASSSLGPLSVDVRDSPTLSTTSVSSSRTDPEAEVDALTNLLLQGLDTVSRKNRSRTGQKSSITQSAMPNTGVNNINNNYKNNTDSSIKFHDDVGNISNNLAASHGEGGTEEEISADKSNRVRNRPCQTNHECFRCHRNIPVGEHIHLSALRTRFHVSCFSCYACGVALTASTQTKSTLSLQSPSDSGLPAAYFHAGDRLLCDRCVLTTVENCHSCGRPIAERMLRALGHAYHPSCFACHVCKKTLDGQPFTIDVHGKIHCLEDFHLRYAPRCHKCAKPIAPGPGENEARRVVTGGHSYHVMCFRRNQS